MKKLLFSLLFIISLAKAQVVMTDGNNTFLSSQNILLELKAANANRGLLLPRLSLTSTIDAAPLNTHTSGILVYNTAIGGSIEDRVYPGLYYNDGTQWARLSTGSEPIVGDLKYSALSIDHDGWYLMNGRNLSSLTTTAQQNATSLGLTTILPDMSGRFIKAKAAAENTGILGGNNNIIITQANLPSFTMGGLTTRNGDHSHSFNDRGIGTVYSVEVNNNPRADNDFSTNKTTSSEGAHSHTFTVRTNGSSTPIVFDPSFMASYIFVYLGQ